MATLASIVAPRRAHRIAQRDDWFEPLLFEAGNWEIDSPMGSWSYAYDIANTNDSTKNQSCTYAADDLNRLKSANCGSVWSQAFTYDPMGNLTKTAAAGMNYPAAYGAHNQVTSGTTAVYDLNGNQTKNTILPATTFTWNAAGQMVSAGSATATYDALGRMVETVNGSTATEYVYSPQGSQYAVVSGTTLLRGLVPLPGGDTAVYNNSGLNYIRRTDVLGSSRLATTWATHQVYSMESYAPFGEPSDQSGTPDRSFTGQDQDLLPNSTIYDFQFRKQDSTSGRWLSPDPSGWNAVDFTNPQSLNRYAYAGNSPLMSVDRLGLDSAFCTASGCTIYPSGDCPPNYCVDVYYFEPPCYEDASCNDPEFPEGEQAPPQLPPQPPQPPQETTPPAPSNLNQTNQPKSPARQQCEANAQQAYSTAMSRANQDGLRNWGRDIAGGTIGGLAGGCAAGAIPSGGVGCPVGGLVGGLGGLIGGIAFGGIDGGLTAYWGRQRAGEDYATAMQQCSQIP